MELHFIFIFVDERLLAFLSERCHNRLFDELRAASREELSFVQEKWFLIEQLLWLGVSDSSLCTMIFSAQVSSASLFPFVVSRLQLGA